MEARRSGVIRPRWLLALIVTASLSTVWTPRPAGAAAPSITVIQNQAVSDFPKQLAFGVVAQSTAQIASVRIAYRVGDDPVTVEGVASFSPGFRVTATRRIDLQSEYYPPGVVIHYQWLIQDMTGGELDTNWADLRVVDPRFLWHQSTQGGVVLHWYAGDAQFSDAVLASAATALAVAQKEAGVAATSPVNVYLYANLQDFRSAIATGSNQWIGGLAFPLYRLVLLLAPTEDAAGAQRRVAEEMTHVAIDTTGEDVLGPLPTWLDEGLAVVAEGPTEPVFAQALQSAVATNHVMSLQSVSGNFPEATDQATLAYAESESLVRYFLDKYGREKLGQLIAAFRKGDTADEAFQKTIGIGTGEFQQAWLTSLTSAPAAAPAPERSGVMRVLTAPVDLIGAIVRDVLKMFQSTKGQPA